MRPGAESVSLGLLRMSVGSRCTFLFSADSSVVIGKCRCRPQNLTNGQLLDSLKSLPPGLQPMARIGWRDKYDSVKKKMINNLSLSLFCRLSMITPIRPSIEEENKRYQVP